MGGKGGKGSQQGKGRGGGGKILGRKGTRSGDKGLRGERGEIISTGKGVEKILGRKGRRSGGKKPTGKGGKDLRKEKGEALRGGKALGGKGWEGSQQGKGGNNLRKERGKRSGKALKGRRERISTGKGGKGS